MPLKNNPLTTSATLALLLFAAAPARADSISAFCESRGGKLVDAPNPNGSKTSVCVLKDGTRINAVAYFRNQHRTK